MWSRLDSIPVPQADARIGRVTIDGNGKEEPRIFAATPLRFATQVKLGN
jgi:hypothetical protein